jgi:predicted Zn-dependent protease
LNYNAELLHNFYNFEILKTNSMNKHSILSIAMVGLISQLFFSTCKNKDDKSLNLFRIQDDIELGQQLEQEIANNPQTYPLLSESQYPQAYSYIRGLRDSVLNSGKVFYKNEFPWKVYIINDNATLNAFCAPGGYIYIYTGLIKYLTSEDELIGVLAHEMAHADRRHSTDQLTQRYGLSLLIGIVAGTTGQDQLAQIAGSLTSLAFSRSDEKEADEYSVKYLCPTTYNAAGAAGFFEKIEAQGGNNVPQFLSTHPNPDNRIQNIKQNKTDLACGGNETYSTRYQQFKNSLP